MITDICGLLKNFAEPSLQKQRVPFVFSYPNPTANTALAVCCASSTVFHSSLFA
jgi:hypothetical protein